MKRFLMSLSTLMLFVFQSSQFPLSSYTAPNKYSSTPSAPPLVWNTFLSVGGTDWYGVRDSTVDVDGNIYLTGTSSGTWGDPINPYSGDMFLAKINNQGVLQWNTFFGAAPGGGHPIDDNSYLISLDQYGEIFVAGYSDDGWGFPADPLPDSAPASSAFVVKFDNYGEVIWNTFMPLGGGYPESMTVDASGNSYLAGYSHVSWGTPVREFTSAYFEGFAAKIDVNGHLQWNTFLGGSGASLAISAGQNGKVYVAGENSGTWGSPVDPFVSNVDASVVQLDGTGHLEWNTFLGGPGHDTGQGDIFADANGNVYLIGASSAAWGEPKVSFGGGDEGFIAKLNSTGHLVWNTFIGCAAADYVIAMKVLPGSDIYITGLSTASWGNPSHGFAGGSDLFVARYNVDGNRIWNTFIGSTGGDSGRGFGLDRNQNVYLTGSSAVSWGTPLNVWTSQYDVFFAKLGYNYDHQIYLPILVR